MVVCFLLSSINRNEASSNSTPAPLTPAEHDLAKRLRSAALAHDAQRSMRRRHSASPATSSHRPLSSGTDISVNNGEAMEGSGAESDGAGAAAPPRRAFRRLVARYQRRLRRGRRREEALSRQVRKPPAGHPIQSDTLHASIFYIILHPIY
jgi:hypothetical protein